MDTKSCKIIIIEWWNLQLTPLFYSFTNFHTWIHIHSLGRGQRGWTDKTQSINSDVSVNVSSRFLCFGSVTTVQRHPRSLLILTFFLGPLPPNLTWTKNMVIMVMVGLGLLDFLVAGVSLIIGLAFITFIASILCATAFFNNAKDVVSWVLNPQFDGSILTFNFSILCVFFFVTMTTRLETRTLCKLFKIFNH